MKTRLLLASGVAVAVTLAALAWFQRSPQAATETAPAFPVATAPAQAAALQPASAEPACRFTPGQRFTFALDGATSWKNAPQSRVTTPESDVVWQATLAFEVLTAGPSSAVLLARIDGLDPNAAARFGEGITQSFLARVSVGCQVEGYAMHTGTPPGTARAQQGLLHELMFLQPGEASAPFDYDDATGHALATITRHPGGVKRVVHEYARTWSPLMSPLTLVDAEATITRGQAVWFERLVSVLEVTAGDTIARARSSLAVQALTPREEQLEGASREVSDYRWVNLLLPVASRPAFAPSPMQQALVLQMKKVPFKTAVAEFQALLDGNVVASQNWQRMAAFLDAHPEQVRPFTAQLVGAFPDEHRAAGFAVLSRVQATEAREALLGVWRGNGQQPLDRARASLALATRGDVGEGFARELQRSAAGLKSADDGSRFHATQNLLHLGILANLHGEQPEVTQIANATVAAALSAVQGPADATPVFSAMGNIGDPANLPALETWSRSSDAELRARVAIGMRRMPPPASRDFTVAWLRRETSPLVVREIYEVLQGQYLDANAQLDSELIELALRHLLEKPQVATRQPIYQLLAPHVAHHAGVREALRQMVRYELENETGMLSYVLGLLPPRDRTVALSQVPSLAGQFAGEALPDDEPVRPVVDPKPGIEQLQEVQP